MLVLSNATQNITTQAFLTSLVTNSSLFALQVGAFLYLKQRLECPQMSTTVCISPCWMEFPVFDWFVLSYEEDHGIADEVVEMASSHDNITFVRISSLMGLSEHKRAHPESVKYPTVSLFAPVVSPLFDVSHLIT